MSNIIPFVVKITQDFSSKDAPFVAYSPEFDIASAGTSKIEAKKNLVEAVSIVLHGAKVDGNLAELLEDAGFAEIDGKIEPKKVEIEELSVTI